jgi:two-component system, sensor histidine kinase
MLLKIPLKFILVFALIVIAIGSTSYYSYRNIVLSSESGTMISQSRQTLFLIDRVSNQVTSLEDNAGRAVLTGDRMYFDDYDTSRQMLTQEVELLKKFEKTNPTQQQNIANLQLKVNAALAMVDNAFKMRTDSLESTLTYIETGRGKVYFDEIKNTLTRMKDDESSLFALLESENSQATYQSVRAILLSAGLALLFILCLLFLLNSDISKRKRVEQLALEIEKKFQHIFENMADMVFICDYNGYFKILNQRAINITGYTPEELRGKHFSFIIAPGWVQGLSQFYAAQFKNKTDETLKEFQIVTKTGEKKWVEQKAVTLKNGNRVTGFQCIVRDISVPKNMESGMVQSNNKFQNIFNSSPFAISIAELESGIIHDINEEFISVFGYTRDDVKEHSIINIGMLRREEINKIAEDARIYGTVKNREHKFYSKSGEPVTCLYSNIPVDFDGIPCLLMMYNNISELKRLEIALTESDKKFLAIFSSSTQAVCVSEITDDTKPGLITEVNSAFCELFQIGKAQVIGHTMTEIGLIEEQYFEKVIADFAGKKYISNHEMNLNAVSGEKLTCLVSFNEVELNGTLNKVWIFNNITERKKLENELVAAKEKAEESIHAKESFVANMSHEIRTPITGIMGLTELLGETPLADEQKEYLSGIMHSSESLLTIINEILDISKINAGKIIIEKVPFNLHKIIKNVAFTLEPRALQKGILFKCRIDESVPENVVGDSVRLSQILWNLAGNAIKFTDKGFVEVSVIKLSEEKNKIRLLFTVIDTGIGIAKNRLKNIFEEFTQADSTISRKYGGTGLGLPIANKLVELHGGTISIESQEGLGSAFRFSLEYGKYSPQYISPDIAIEKLQFKDQVDLAGLNVLLAEDNIINQGVCRKILTNRGASIDIVDNGKKVIDMLVAKPYDIILMDIQMPEMNGYEAARYIRSMKSTKANIPIIALTAFAMEGENDKCFAAGMNGYISKPFKANELCTKVWQYTRQKKSFATY